MDWRAGGVRVGRTARWRHRPRAIRAGVRGRRRCLLRGAPGEVRHLRRTGTLVRARRPLLPAGIRLADRSGAAWWSGLAVRCGEGVGAEVLITAPTPHPDHPKWMMLDDHAMIDAPLVHH